MKKNKPSLLQRLTGAYDEDEFFDADYKESTRDVIPDIPSNSPPKNITEEDRQIDIDLVNTPNNILITACIPGVDAEHIDVSITRELVTISANTADRKTYRDEDYYYREVFWGSFSRTIVLPQEVEAEEAKAKIKDGILTIKLPKIDKDKQTKLKIAKQ